MKYCPYCGAVLPDGAPSFCPECGESLVSNEAGNVTKAEPRTKKQRPRKVKTPKKVKNESADSAETFSPVDDYDGYYDDRIPIDEGKRRDGLDKHIVKKVVALVLALLVVIAACLALLYVI